jgi:hypothetical protein
MLIGNHTQSLLIFGSEPRARSDIPDELFLLFPEPPQPPAQHRELVRIIGQLTFLDEDAEQFESLDPAIVDEIVATDCVSRGNNLRCDGKESHIRADALIRSEQPVRKTQSQPEESVQSGPCGKEAQQVWKKHFDLRSVAVLFDRGHLRFDVAISGEKLTVRDRSLCFVEETRDLP